MPNKKLKDITAKIIERSKKTREAYLLRLKNQVGKTSRDKLGCANLAHAYASIPTHIKENFVATGKKTKNFAIITAYNDMLSAHQPFKDYPDIIKKELWNHGANAQVAGGVPAMCDGITQGYAGMELSLFSRDVIAMSVAIALSHNVFDGAFYLGVCDKIVPGLLIGALSFGNLPSIFVPSGPMKSGISNDEKSRARQAFAVGEISREKLLKSEMKSYHDVGTCTFYGTANSNQMMIELMGLHLPNSAFINPHTPLREALVCGAAARMADSKNPVMPIGKLIDERNIINALVGLMATGGSTNHTIHLIAIAHVAGIILNWDDFDAISRITPLLTRIYPNGKADVNQFEAAGGLAFVVQELLNHGLLHEDANTIMGSGMEFYTKNPFLAINDLDNTNSLSGEKIVLKNIIYKDAPKKSAEESILRSVEKAFSQDGGLRILKGKIGRAVIKISAVKEEHQKVEAPAIVFASQEEFLERFKNGELERDFIAVLPFQGPRSNGMPELHKLTPALGILQDKGYKVALITDGRMSGASGKIPAALHVSPEAKMGGAIKRIKDGDMIILDAKNGILDVLIDESEWQNRALESSRGSELGVKTNEKTDKDSKNLNENSSEMESKEDSKNIDSKSEEIFGEEIFGFGRELFASFRSNTSSAESGAMSFGGIFK